MQDRTDSSVKHSVICVTVLNNISAGERKSSAGHALPNKAFNCGQVVEMNPILSFSRTLEGMSRWRKSCRRDSGCKLGIECIDVDIFQDRFEGGAGEQAYLLVNLAAFFFRQFIFCLLHRLLCVRSSQHARS